MTRRDGERERERRRDRIISINHVPSALCQHSGRALKPKWDEEEEEEEVVVVVVVVERSHKCHAEVSSP